MVFENSTVNWKQLWESIQKPAAYISKKINSDKQQVIAILLPNSVEFIQAYLSVIHSGHIALLLDPAYKSLELDSIIEQVPPKLIITNGDNLSKFSPVHQKIAVKAEELNGYKGKIGKIIRRPAREQIASLTFTSGTTGKPKAVPNTHYNHIWNIVTCSKVWDWTADDTLLISVPLSHMLGIVMGLSGSLYHANTIYLQKWFDVDQTLKMLGSGKISFFSHAASAYMKLVQGGQGDFDLSKVRLCVSGAAPLPPEVWRQFKEFYGLEIVETYGSSETGRIAGNSLNERVTGSPGKPLPGVKVRVNSRGELEVNSSGLFPGYYKNPRATAAALTKDGYWRTGDIAEIRDGYIFLKGRVQERIRKYGYVVSPRDVEWAMHKHPKVKDIFVMGNQLPNEPDDELVYFVVGDITDEEIKVFCKQHLLFAWRPDKIIHLNDLPRTRSGKAKIAKLKEMAAR